MRSSKVPTSSIDVRSSRLFSSTSTVTRFSSRTVSGRVGYERGGKPTRTHRDRRGHDLQRSR
ncbi:MAG: hypothetical protein AAF348_10145, partial [Bacteroidota bacterium]